LVILATTPPPPCPLVTTGSVSTIYNASSASTSSYDCHAFIWTTPITRNVNLTFQLQHLPSYWYVDDVSVNNGAVELLTNGGFETGSLYPWTRTDPFGPCGGTSGQVDSKSPRTGSYELCDGSNTCADKISQSFQATAGQLYTISFWLKSNSNGLGVSVVVTVS
jgi:hypothetical protein